MLIENEFEIPEPVDHAWRYLLDVEKVAPCAPGAEITEIVDDRTWKGKILVKLGPVSLSFAGTVALADQDDANHRVVLEARGTEQRGKGAASATVTSWLEGRGQATVVKMQADVTLTGAVAQVSRGLLPDVSAKLTRQFAECLRESMVAEQALEPSGAADLGEPRAASSAGPAMPAPPRSRAKAIGGLGLGLWAIFRALGRSLGRLFGARD